MSDVCLKVMLKKTDGVKSNNAVSIDDSLCGIGLNVWGTTIDLSCFSLSLFKSCI